MGVVLGRSLSRARGVMLGLVGISWCWVAITVRASDGTCVSHLRVAWMEVIGRLLIGGTVWITIIGHAGMVHGKERKIAGGQPHPF